MHGLHLETPDGSGFDGLAGRRPFGHAVLEAPRRKALLAQAGDGFKRHDAIRSAAISDDLLGGVQRRQSRFQFAERYIDRARHVAERILIWWTHVENRHRAIAQAGLKLVPRYRLKAVALIEITPDHLVDLGEIDLGHPLNRLNGFQHARTGQSINHELALAFGGDEAGPPHRLQVLRYVGDRDAELIGQQVDVARPLPELFDQFEPLRMTECFRNQCELFE